ncbi:hypothetical protein [Lysobacter gummosus]
MARLSPIAGFCRRGFGADAFVSDHPIVRRLETKASGLKPLPQ